MYRASTTTNILRGFFILFILLCANTSKASTIDENDPTTWPRKKIKEEIKYTQKDHKFALLAQNIQLAHARIKGDANCSRALRLAEKYKKEMLALNQQYAGRADSEYQRRFTTAKRNNSEQLTKYRQCVSRVLFDSGKSKAIGVSTYDGLQNLTEEIEGQLDAKSVKDVGQYIVKIEDYLKNLEAALKAIDTNIMVIGTLEGIFGGVKVKSPGSLWRDGQKGYIFRINDELKTDERGRARIEFTDQDKERNAGPTIVNVGSNSHIRIRSFTLSLGGERQSKGIIGVLRGVIRAFTKNWGNPGSFSVRGGPTLLGIRGTEVMLDYNPDSDTLAALVNHGTVDIFSKSATNTLTNREKITVKNGVAGNKIPLSQSEWIAALQQTPDIGTISLSNIANRISRRQLMDPQSPGRQVLNPPTQYSSGSTSPLFTPNEARCVAEKICKPNEDNCRNFIKGCGGDSSRLSAKERDRCRRQRRAIIEYKIPALKCLNLNRQASDRQVPGKQVLNPSARGSASPPVFTSDEARCVAKEFCKPLPGGKVCWNHLLECSEAPARLSENDRNRCRILRENTASIPLCVNLK
jgi:hypothetical protein